MTKKLILGTIVAASIVQSTSVARADKQAIGNIIGGIIGGAIGSQIGGGNGNKAAIVIGAIAGTMIGGKVGRDMDELDRRAFDEAQRRALRGQVGQREDWRGRDYGSSSGATGSFTTSREGYNNRTGEYCREYHSVIRLRNRTEENRGIACSRRDGSWYETRSSEVRFNENRGGHHGGRHNNPPPRHNTPPRHQPQPPQQPLPPPPPSHGHSRYEATTYLDQVTRRTGGEWFRITLHRPISLSQIQMFVYNSGASIHETWVYLQNGQREQIRDLSWLNRLYAGSSVASEELSSLRTVQVIDIRVESMGGVADISVNVLSDESQPALSVTRF